MKWVVLNADLKICHSPFNTEGEAKAAIERAAFPPGVLTVKCVDKSEALHLMDQHFRELECAGGACSLP
jgi:hypothetical protein